MWTKTAKLSDFKENTGLVVEIGGQQIALFKSEDGVYAIDNLCRHQGGPLGEGHLEGGVVTCPWHAWEYDVKTGACQSVPGVKQKSFPVRVEGEEVWVDV
jgi:NAD(P)H-dependent nitrite reductase small subunit